MAGAGPRRAWSSLAPPVQHRGTTRDFDLQGLRSVSAKLVRSVWGYGRSAPRARKKFPPSTFWIVPGDRCWRGTYRPPRRRAR